MKRTHIHQTVSIPGGATVEICMKDRGIQITPVNPLALGLLSKELDRIIAAHHAGENSPEALIPFKVFRGRVPGLQVKIGRIEQIDPAADIPDDVKNALREMISQAANMFASMVNEAKKKEEGEL